MQAHLKTYLFVLLILAISTKNSVGQDPGLVVRIAKIQIDSTKLKKYTEALKEEVEAAVHIEPGVRSLYAVAEKDNPTRIIVFEIYANKDAFKSHLETPHFKKYKTGTKEMVTSLELKETVPVVLATKSHLKKESNFIRIVDLVIDSTQLETFKAAIKEDAEEAVRKEPGAYTLYVTSEKNNPSHIMVFEIYANEEAHNSHQQTPHFKKYKNTIKDMVNSTVRTEMISVVMEAKQE